VTMVLLAFWLLLRALRTQSDLRFALAGFGMALTVLMRFGSLSTVAVLSVLVLAAHRWTRAALACAAGFACGIAPYLGWSRLRYGGFLATFRDGWQNFGGPEESPLYFVKNFANIFSWVTVVGLALCIGRWAWKIRELHNSDRQAPSADETLRGHRGKLEAFLWLWAIAVFLFFSMLPHKEPRYIMPVEPPLFLLAGIGLSVLVAGRDVRRRIAGTVLLVGALGYTFAPVRHRFEDAFLDRGTSEEMQVSDFLTHSVPPTTVLYTANFSSPDYAYYTNLQIHDLVPEGPGWYEQLNHLPVDGILIAYQPGDQTGLPSLEWLDANPHYKRFREFPQVVLYTYTASSK